MTNANVAKKAYAEMLGAGLVRYDGPKFDSWIRTFHLPGHGDTGHVSVVVYRGVVHLHVVDKRGRYYNHVARLEPFTLDEAVAMLREFAATGPHPSKFWKVCDGCGYLHADDACAKVSA